jgi:hypothetical protein
MSARDEFYTWLQANWASTPLYALDDYVSLDDLPATNEAPVLLVDFPPALERLVTIAVNQKQGWREDGEFQLFMLHPVGYPVAPTRFLCEQIRDMVRAKRIGQTVTMACEPFTAYGEYDGKWLLFVAFVDYYRDAFN